MPHIQLEPSGEDKLWGTSTSGSMIVEGHYALHADAFDSEQAPTPVLPLSPIEQAQRDAAEAAIELNAMPREQQTPRLIAKADRLRVWASFLVSNQNVSLARNNHELDA